MHPRSGGRGIAAMPLRALDQLSRTRYDRPNRGERGGEMCGALEGEFVRFATAHPVFYCFMETQRDGAQRRLVDQHNKLVGLDNAIF
jgi:hypothetical protein